MKRRVCGSMSGGEVLEGARKYKVWYRNASYIISTSSASNGTIEIFES